MKWLGLFCTGFVLLFLAGCPAMVLDRMKNKREISVENLSFQKEDYQTITIIPYSHSEDIKRMEYADKIFDVSSRELKKRGYTVIDKERILELIETEKIDITDEKMALVLSKVKKNHVIRKLGTGLGADAVMAFDVKKLYRGFWYTGNCTELHALLYDMQTEKLIWHGYAFVIHEVHKNYREKVFRIIFREMFKDL